MFLVKEAYRCGYLDIDWDQFHASSSFPPPYMPGDMLYLPSMGIEC